MSVEKPRLVDSTIDTKLVEKLKSLNKEYRLGLSIRDYPTDLPIPNYVRPVEHEAWNEIRDRISSLHKTTSGRTKLSSALSSYKAWARKQKGETHWQEKPHADPRVLGAPYAHIEQLRRVLGISRYSSSQCKKRKPEEISGANFADMSSSSNVQYPQFSAEAQGDIARSNSGRILQSDLQHSSILSSRQSQQYEDSSRQKKRIKASVSPQEFTITKGNVIDTETAMYHLESTALPQPALKSTATVQISTASATTSRQTSFNTNASFLSAAAGGGGGADIETPGTSFGSTAPPQQGAMPPPASRKHKSSRQSEPRPIAIPERSQNAKIPAALPSPSNSQSDFTPSFSLEQALLDARLQYSAPVKTGGESGFSLSQASSSTEMQMLQLAAKIESGSLSQQPGIRDSQDTIALGTPPASRETVVANQTRSGIPTTRPLANKLACPRSSDSTFSSIIPQSTVSSVDRVQTSRDRPTLDSKARSVSVKSDKSKKSQSEVEKELFSNHKSPFHKASSVPEKFFDFRALYEMNRAYLQNIQLSKMNLELSPSRKPAIVAQTLENPTNESYNEFLDEYLAGVGLTKHRFERSSRAAWEAATGDSTETVLSGKLAIEIVNNSLEATFNLFPLQIDKSHRLSRKFGADSFFVLNLPDISEKRSDLADKFQHWLSGSRHHFLGRVWRAFFSRPSKKVNRAFPYQALFFAVSGSDFPDRDIPIRDIVPGFRSSVSDHQMIDWLLNLKHNREQPALKLFARIALGLTKTVSSIAFRPDQIVYTCDARSCCPHRRSLTSDSISSPDHGHSGKIMNDGCGRISREAACAIVKSAGIAGMPSAFQGRIAGAKGAWLVDSTGELLANGDPFWIEITESQLKFNALEGRTYNVDPLLVTFDVHSHSLPLSPHVLNFSLMQILEAGGITHDVFIELLREALERSDNKLDAALDLGGPILIDWLQGTMPVISERASSGEIKMEGAFPDSTAEKLVMLTASGHHPMKDRIHIDTCMDALKRQWNQVDQKPSMPLAKSTNVLMVPDPLGILEEGEIFLQFSRPFEDEVTGKPLHSLADMPVLVTRFPAYLPWDIQKVQGVYKHEFSDYEDVIIFSVKGDCSLAEMLSGGDFDGDKAWVCWEQRLVEGFRNSAIGTEYVPRDFGIEKDKETAHAVTKRLGKRGLWQKGIAFNMRSSMLGRCANWYMAYTYHEAPIRDPLCLRVGQLLGHLVDTAKNGYTFTEREWRQFLKENHLPLSLDKPAWKCKKASNPNMNIIMDKLRFGIINDHRIMRLRQFKARCEEIGEYDGGLSKIYRDTEELAGNTKDRDELKSIVTHLKKEFSALLDEYLVAVGSRKPEEPGWLRTEPESDSNGQSRRRMLDLRRRFLAIQPPMSSQYSCAARWRLESEYMLLSTAEWDRRSQRLAKETVAGSTVDIPQEDRLLLGADFGSWTLFKASVLNYNYKRMRRFCYVLAGKELCDIKALLKNVPSNVFSVTRDVYTSFRVDKSFVKKLISGVPKTAVVDEDNEDIETQDDMSGDEDF